MCHCHFIAEIDDAVEAGEKDHGGCIEIALVAQILPLADIETVQILKICLYIMKDRSDALQIIPDGIFHILDSPRDSQCMKAVLPDERGGIEVFTNGVNFYAVVCQGIPAKKCFSFFYDTEPDGGGQIPEETDVNLFRSITDQVALFRFRYISLRDDAEVDIGYRPGLTPCYRAKKDNGDDGIF